MRTQFSLRSLFGSLTLACGLAAALTLPGYHALVSLTAVLLATIALWPRLYGHGG